MKASRQVRLHHFRLSRGNTTQRWLVGFGAGMPWASILGELTAVETRQRVLAFEARGQSDWFTRSGYKTPRIQSEERLELARAVAALLIQLARGMSEGELVTLDGAVPQNRMAAHRSGGKCC